MHMAIVKWEPFREIDSFFDDMRAPMLGMSGDMAIDMYEEGNNIIAEMSMPGIDGEKVDVTVDGNYLRVVGTREETQEKKDKHFYSKEIRRGSFERAVRIPEAVAEDKVEAEYKDGVLKVTMPKAEEGRGKVKVVVKK
jgi:HSP20 family protein